MLKLVVTGTDTGIGKTVFAAGLARRLGACYWKPVQAGLEGETDSAAAARLGELAAERVLPEAFRLRMPASPHRAAQIDGVGIDPDALAPPDTHAPLVIEGAGGLLVPLTRTATMADLFARWRLPVVLCAGTRLGTINHTLLSLEALRYRSIPLIGVALIGDDRPDTAGIIAEMGRVRILGRLPWLAPLTPQTLERAFAQAFGAEDFRHAGNMSDKARRRAPPPSASRSRSGPDPGD